jgi:hypothetical protein
MRLLKQRYDMLAAQRRLTKQGRCCFCAVDGGAIHAIVAGLGKGDRHEGMRCCPDCLKHYVWDWE